MREDRRSVLKLVVLAPLGVALAGCGREQAAPRPSQTEVPLDGLPVGRRVTVLHRGAPVEVLRGADGAVVARSLLCTHMGCTVQWQEAQGRYWCPCHFGTFDPSGQVTGGPPQRRLETVAARVAGDRVVLGG